MLNSLNIKNFRNLKDLKIRSLGQVNLFTGKNNTGKSTILEALSVYATQGDINLIYQILDERGENIRQSTDINRSITEINLKALSSLFTNRQIGFMPTDALVVGTIDNTLFGEQTSEQKFISLRFIKYYDEVVNDENDPNATIRRKRTIIQNDLELITDYNVGLEIRTKNSSFILPLDRERPYRILPRNIGIGNPENFQFIRTKNIDREINGKLWDNITLSEKENYVIDALRIIEPNVERIAFIEDNRERNPVIKLKGNNNVLPLKSMGDGINRVLTIILALVNSDNGFLLLDEFENGLHYSVQEKLWNIIFNLAQKLNIQVFVTTHSEDCIYGFEQVLNHANNKADGKLIRLDVINDVIRQVEFNANELRIASDQAIETR